ncbi:hypothetical protein GGTG_05704 [Gaeumannomyces tritici R3-111a-1]|uniref:Uncharacterized protein n=1 Tax=Gaeumannomyces tritici (strain R3-111a-1) TaxID=644352 RepID=J3NWP2_GAET3|nr:hypothetical protein GGTG_05704 [Gaeumannomyces tritici R3-111a-1]EJT75774.1 hypothetical protein GGTG_05704 [Gaeumannomyces tritici R3-111a-1]
MGCYPTSNWIEPISQYITSDLCKTVRLCSFRSVYVLCDTDEPLKPPLGSS